MNSVGQLVERLVAAGMSIAEASDIIASAVAAGAAQASYRRSPGAVRTERWRVTKRHQASQCDTEPAASPTVTERHKASHVTPVATVPIEEDLNKKEKKKDRSTAAREASRGTRIDPKWAPSSEDREAAKREGLTEKDIEREAAKFRDYWLGRSGQGGIKLDWPATWRNWCRTAAERLGRSKSSTVDELITILIGDPSWNAWLAYNQDNGKHFAVKLMNGAAEANRRFVVPSLWPPGHEHLQAAE